MVIRHFETPDDNDPTPGYEEYLRNKKHTTKKTKMKTAQKTITVKADSENPEAIEIVADAIIKIADAFERINKGRLSRRELILLIQDNCEQVGQGYRKKPIARGDVEKVLDSIQSLKKAYIKDVTKK